MKFEMLENRVKVGDEIILWNSNGKRIEGKLIELDEKSLVVQNNSENDVFDIGNINGIYIISLSSIKMLQIKK